MAADRKLLAAAFAAIAFLTAGPARGAVARPTQIAPAGGAVVQFLPSMAWTPVPGADKYQFQISADAGMNSPVLGDGKDNFFTRNTRATLTETVPNGTYYWRVRATNAAGEISAWTQPRSFKKQWNLQPALQSPGSGASLSFPAKPVVLNWSGVAGAAHYLVSVASDPTLGSLVLKYSNQDDPKGPPNIAANSAAITVRAGARRVLLERHAGRCRGQPRRRDAGRLLQLALAVGDHDAPRGPERGARGLRPALLVEPRPRRGALRGRGQLLRPTSRPARRSAATTRRIATSLSPTTVFKDNVYYWRVRALDPDGNAGRLERRAVVHEDLRQGRAGRPGDRDEHQEPAHARQPRRPGHRPGPRALAGYQTACPVVHLGPGPGRGELRGRDRADWTGSALHLGARRPTLKKTSVPALDAARRRERQPGRSGRARSPRTPCRSSRPATYCFRVRARSDRAAGRQEVWGDYTYLRTADTDSAAAVGPAFTWTATRSRPGRPRRAATRATSARATTSRR